MTTVRGDGQPQTSLVWFLYHDGQILVYSQDGTIRNRNVAKRPAVALNLDSDGDGGAVVTVEGTARIDPDAPAPADNPAYLAKYLRAIEANNWTPESFGRDYPVPIRVTIDRVRSWG